MSEDVKKLHDGSSPEEEIRTEISRLLNRPIADDRKVLEIITDAITAKYVDPSLVEQAVKQSVHQYETQLRVFAISVAKRQLRRVLKLIDILDQYEDELNDPETIRNLEAKDLVRLYGIFQANLNTSMDFIKRVTDQRIELAHAQAAILTATEKEEMETLSGLPTLDSQQRDKIRRILQGVVSEVTDMQNTGTANILPPKNNGDPRAK
jgi:hypothetical protein